MERVASRPCCRSTSPTSPRSGSVPRSDSTSPASTCSTRARAPPAARDVALTGGPGVPPTAFVKLAPFDEQQRRFVTSVGMGVAEARFYRDLAPEIPVRIPDVWFSDFEGDGYAMVLEDLVAAGCRFPHPLDDDIAFRARDIVESARRAARALLGVAALRGRRRSRVARTQGHGRLRRRGKVRADGRRHAGRSHAGGVPSSRRHLPRAQRRHRGAVELRSAHARARRSAHGQSLRGRRRRQPHGFPRLGRDRSFAGTARRRVRVVQLDPGRGPRRRRARAHRPILRVARRRGHRPRRGRRLGPVPTVRRSTRGYPPHRPPAWDRSGSRCTSGSAGRSGRPPRASNWVASICSNASSADP